MPTLVLKLTDPRDGKEWWVRWSTVVDAPTSPALPMEAFSLWLHEELRMACPWFAELPDWGIFLTCIAIPKLLETVERHGTSYPALYRGALHALQGNRAGEDEACLTPSELIDRYREGE